MDCGYTQLVSCHTHFSQAGRASLHFVLRALHAKQPRRDLRCARRVPVRSAMGSNFSPRNPRANTPHRRRHNGWLRWNEMRLQPYLLYILFSLTLESYLLAGALSSPRSGSLLQPRNARAMELLCLPVSRYRILSQWENGSVDHYCTCQGTVREGRAGLT